MQSRTMWKINIERNEKSGSKSIWMDLLRLPYSGRRTARRECGHKNDVFAFCIFQRRVKKYMYASFLSSLRSRAALRLNAVEDALAHGVSVCVVRDHFAVTPFHFRFQFPSFIFSPFFDRFSSLCASNGHRMANGRRWLAG